MFRRLIFFLAATLLGCLMAQEAPGEEDQQQPAVQQTGISNLPGELNISDGLLRAVGTAGVLITGIAGIAALLSFLLPVFGFRSCMIFGNCEPGYESTAYNNAGSNSIYDQPGYTGYQYNGNPYKKRSLEYVGPILKMLNAAYEKYGPKPRQAKSVPSEVQS